MENMDLAHKVGMAVVIVILLLIGILGGGTNEQK